MTALIIVNTIATALLWILIWFGVSGGLSRLIARSTVKSCLYTIPRSVTRKMIKDGGALDIALGFIAESQEIQRYLSGDYDTDDFFAWELRLHEYVGQLPLWNALLTSLCCEGRHLKYIKRYPQYLMIEMLNFKGSCGLVKKLRRAYS